MIKSNYSIKILKITFNKIVKQLHKNLYTKSVISNSSNGLNNVDGNENKGNSYDMINPKV